MVVSDISWIKAPSTESRKFFKDIYPEVDTIENKIKLIQNLGYEFIDYVIVPKQDWDDYHKSLEKNLNELKMDKSAKHFVAQIRKEIENYGRNSDDYSYVFYVMRKV